jgi:thioredoxin reductase (NADPH)
MQDRAKKNPKIVFHWNTELIEAHGEKNRLQKVTIKNAVTGAVEVLDANGLFYAIGM